MFSRLFKILLLVTAVSVPIYSGFAQAQTCAKISGGDSPFPLGGKAPIPWDKLEGYWTDHEGEQYFYRIEVLDIFKDGSRNVSVDVLDESMLEIIATGVGFVRSGSWDLWARAKGDGIDLKIRIQSFYPKGSTDLNKRVLRASVQDMKPEADKCLNRHLLRKIDELEPIVLAKTL
jgi:hypothetical protein